jgi:hypothetical protein
MVARLLLILIAVCSAHSASASILRVPRDHSTIQAAIDAAKPGDTILVAPGRYQECVSMKPRIVLRSDGNDDRGAHGLMRAAATIIDGCGGSQTSSGVLMAEGSTLDGFTITNVGVYDEHLWQQHFDSHGEELGDDEGAVQAEGTTQGVRIQGIGCTVTNCIIHHNGGVGIGILGDENVTTDPFIINNIVFRNMGGGIGVAGVAEPFIRGNTCTENMRAGIGCRGANPIIIENHCYQNIRAGIGCREGSKALIRGNRCYQNRRAGIGIRMIATAPIVEKNDCYENEMSGIGCRSKAHPILRDNICRDNKLAGIGCDGASPLIVGNRCSNNQQAGIGVQGQATVAIYENRCVDNKLVAIGVTEGSTAIILKNKLRRTGGVPPIIAVKGGSEVTIRDNEILGGGVAAVLLQGKATVTDNLFVGVGEKQGNAIWIREGSKGIVSGNRFDGYRTAVNAKNAEVVVSANEISRFQGTAIIVKDSPSPSHVYGNVAVSDAPEATTIEVVGLSGIVDENTLKRE